MSDVLAIDLGGTRLRAAVASAGDPTRLSDRIDRKVPGDLASFVAVVRALVAADANITALGIAVPGLTRGSHCVWIPNLPYLDGVDLAECFPGHSIGLGNDAQLALLAEATHGAAVGLSDVVLLAIGTGIGSAVMTDGRIVRGAHGGACSFGWASADLDDPGDARSGWLERNAAGRALDRLAVAIGLADGAALVAAARGGNPAAIDVIAMPARALGTSLAAAVALLDPEAVLLAGGVAGAIDVLKEPMLEAARRQLPAHLKEIDLRAGAFGPRAGLVGAAVAGGAGQNWWRLR
ncbi:MAG TPA: ROK family protein [Bauldia sp.]|nr:ROK family protein [Bauldia sp.]